MKNVPIILWYELLRRVRSKAFILSTFLGPVALLGLIGLSIVLSVRSMESGGTTEVAVIDETGALFNYLQSDGDAPSLVLYGAEEDARAAAVAGQIHGYLILPEGVLTGAERPTYYSTESAGLGLQDVLSDRISHAVRTHRFDVAEVPQEVREMITMRISVIPVRLSTEGESEGSSFAYLALGYAMGFLIYITMVIYGSVVMQGVLEEKSSRIVEILISSVRPFELLMGKVLGIGAMGLVQLTTWALMLVVGSVLATVVAGTVVDPTALDLPSTADGAAVLDALEVSLPTLSPVVLMMFVGYFFLGYLLYAGLFAAAGAAAQTQQETQGWLLPILVPIIVALMVIMPVLNQPHSALAVALSLLPLTSPVIMVVRVAVTSVPLVEVLLSLGLLVSGFLFTIWISSRIYRIGILMYGKKARLKDVIRWIRTS